MRDPSLVPVIFTELAPGGESVGPIDLPCVPRSGEYVFVGSHLAGCVHEVSYSVDPGSEKSAPRIVASVVVAVHR